MAGWARAAMILGGALAAASCSRPPNPVVAHDPIPQPPPGYVVTCGAFPVILHGYWAYCAPGQRPAVIEERTLVRTKG